MTMGVAAALMVVTTIAMAACADVNEVVTNRDLDCGEAPEALCIRIADLAVDSRDAELRGTPPASVEVAATDCSTIGREGDATRCWHVHAAFPEVGDLYRWVLELPDGTVELCRC